MNLIKELFPSVGDAGNIVKSVAKGVDESIYTTEEKATNLKDWLNAALPHNRTLRFLVWSVGGVWIASYLSIQITGVFGLSEISDFIRGNFKEFCDPHFDTIIYAYFGVTTISRLKK